jgi:hyaluronoglucosaminidase
MTVPSQGAKKAGFAVRGAIEGFYGRPFSWAEREALVGFLGRRGMNAYVYAPKNDPLHRERWRDLYGPDDLAQLAALSRVSADGGVRLIYAIAPGLSYDAAEPAELARLDAKLVQVLDAGVDGIALLFDDIAHDSPAVDPDLQAELVAEIARRVSLRSPGAQFWFIGNYYAGSAAELAAGRGLFATIYPHPALAYFRAYNRCVPPEVPILWTGPGIFSAVLTAEDASAFRELVGRPVLVWDNFPVNDAIPEMLFLGPYLGRDADLPRSVDGIVVNLMSQPATSRISLSTVADYLRDPAGYDPESSLNAAIAEIGADARGALAVLVDQLRGHPVIAAGIAAPEMAVRTREAFRARPLREASLAALVSYLEEAATCGERLAALRDAALSAEIEPWCAKLADLARAATAGLEALAGGRPAREFRELRDAAQARVEAVGSSRLPERLRLLVAGAEEGVDRFAELFTAIEGELAAQGCDSTVAT